MHTGSILKARISPQWLSEMRRLSPIVPWTFASELVSQIGYHSMPGQRIQFFPISMGQGGMPVMSNVPAAFSAE